MSKERLEDIQLRFIEGKKVTMDDMMFVFSLAERVQELENENRILRTVAESNKYIGEQYLEQNKRYREAIEEAIEYANSPKILTSPAGIEKILSKALVGEV